MAPARSQLLYNKHKGLKTKFEHENHYLEREKETYLKNHKTDIRMMERRKELYSKRRNDIILKRSANESRRQRSASFSGTPGRTSAPPRLEREYSIMSAGDAADTTFVTEIKSRDSQSAGARQVTEHNNTETTRVPEMTKLPEVSKLCPPADTPDLRTVSPCMSTRSATPGKPYLLRQNLKTVRFLPTTTCCQIKTPPPIDLPIDERIKRFLASQADFNKTGPRTPLIPLNRKLNALSSPARGLAGLGVNMVKLESAFDEFLDDNTEEGLQKLVRYTTKLKASARNARNSSIMPRRRSILAAI